MAELSDREKIEESAAVSIIVLLWHWLAEHPAWRPSAGMSGAILGRETIRAIDVIIGAVQAQIDWRVQYGAIFRLWQPKGEECIIPVVEVVPVDQMERARLDLAKLI